MIGVNTSIFKSAGRKLVNLLGTLKDRATYYENNTDSVAEKNRIDDLGILDKATILLTPTATSDARVHSVKTYTGEELVTNGTYNTDLSGWTNTSTHWQWSSGSAYHPLTTSLFPLKQDITNNVGAVLRITFDLTYVQGTAQCFYKNEANSDVSTTFTSSGSYTIITEPVKANTEINFGRAFGHNTEFYIDNVSIVDVSSDFDFDRSSSATRINSDGLVQDMQSITDPELVLNGDFEELVDVEVINGDFSNPSTGWTTETGWTISDGKATQDGSAAGVGATGDLASSGPIFEIGKTYRIQVDVVDYESGDLDVTSSNISLSVTEDGTYYVYYKAITTYLHLRAGYSDFKGSIDNVSVQQVDPNDRWSLGTGWSIEDGKLVGNGAMTSSDVVIQSYDFEDGGTYKITFEITESSRGSVFIREPFNSSSKATGEVGIHTIYGVAGAANDLRLRSDDTFVGKIDNVSIKHVTFEEDNVDLARINYDSNGDNGHILLEPTSTNFITYSEDFNEWTLTRCSLGDKVLSPNGIISAYKIIPNTENAKHEISTSVSSYTTATVSLFAKAAEKHRLQITKSNWGTTDFDLLNETVTSGVGTIESYGNGWYRCTASYTASPSQSSIYIIVADDDGDVTYSGNNSDGIYFWGAQLEALPYATSYIPTLTGSTVTRAAEKLTGSGNTSLIESRQGSFYVDISALAASTGAQISISLSGGNSNDRVLIYSGSGGGEWKAQFRKDSSTYVSISKSATISNQAKIAVAWASGRYVMFVDGVKATAYSTGSETESTTFDGGDLTSIQFSPNNGSGSNLFYGKCKALAVFNEALSDTELENLTS